MEISDLAQMDIEVASSDVLEENLLTEKPAEAQRRDEPKKTKKLDIGQMVLDSLQILKDTKGSTFEDIKQCMAANCNITMNKQTEKSLMQYLQAASEEGILTQARGKYKAVARRTRKRSGSAGKSRRTRSRRRRKTSPARRGTRAHSRRRKRKATTGKKTRARRRSRSRKRKAGTKKATTRRRRTTAKKATTTKRRRRQKKCTDEE